MRNMLAIAAAVSLVLVPAAALAQASSFTLVNATGLDIQSVEIRRFGTDEWKPLSAAPAAGRPAPVEFSDTECAFDIRATLAGGIAGVWRGVNLCEAKIVRLNRNASGVLWVEYD